MVLQAFPWLPNFSILQLREQNQISTVCVVENIPLHEPSLQPWVTYSSTHQVQIWNSNIILYDQCILFLLIQDSLLFNQNFN